jgi:hypothetical protein
MWWARLKLDEDEVNRLVKEQGMVSRSERVEVAAVFCSNANPTRSSRTVDLDYPVRGRY